MDSFLLGFRVPATPCHRLHINDFFVSIYFPQKGIKLSNLQQKTGSHLQPKNIVFVHKEPASNCNTKHTRIKRGLKEKPGVLTTWLFRGLLLVCVAEMQNRFALYGFISMASIRLAGHMDGGFPQIAVHSGFLN